MKISLSPIGWVRSTRKEGEDDRWDDETAHIELDSKQFAGGALMGLADFSHAEIIFYFSQVDPSRIERGARHPRNNTAWPKVGIFAQRAKDRPNQMGSTICKIKSVKEGSLYLEGLDAIDGTPVLDIKPWVIEFGPRGEVRQPSWVSELMRSYWK